MSGTHSTAHDTGLYDSNIHDNQIVALYETDAEARSAKDVLVQAGFSSHSIEVLGHTDAAGATGSGLGYEPTVTASKDDGLWGSIKSLFVPDEDRTGYSTAMSHGHAMLVVTPDGTMDRQHLIHVLESTNPLDFDAKLEEWRQTAYETTGTGAATGATTLGVASTGAATTGTAPGTMDTAATHGTTAARLPGTVPSTATGAGNDTIKVMEERLRVGKREVAAGAVRIRSYIVERPVEESVNLREEHVSVERHAVDRPANAADFGAFEERTIEARATSEEAVVGKEARVVEEIALNKTATDRTETIHDTVRKTEVEIEGDAASKSGTLGGTTTTLNPNATPDAGTSGANSPRK